MTDTNKVHAFSYTDQNLDELSISDLRNLHIALKAITDHLYAEFEALYHRDEDTNLCATGKLLDGLLAYLDTFRYDIIDNLKGRTPMTQNDINIRAEVILPYYIVDGDLTVANIVMSKVLAELARAEFCEHNGIQYRPRGEAA